MQTIKIKRPLTTDSKRGGVTFPAGTEITLTDEWGHVPEGVKCRVILVGGQRHLVFDSELVNAQREQEMD